MRFETGFGAVTFEALPKKRRDEGIGSEKVTE